MFTSNSKVSIPSSFRRVLTSGISVMSFVRKSSSMWGM